MKKDKGVYILQCKGRFKIGASTTISTRVSSIQTPWPVRLIAVKYTEDIYKLEKSLHREYSNKRVHGEWFAFSKKELMDIIKINNFKKINPPTDFDSDTIACLQDTYQKLEDIKKQKAIFDKRIREAVSVIIDEEITKAQSRDKLLDEIIYFLSTQKTGEKIPPRYKQNILERIYHADWYSEVTNISLEKALDMF